MFSVGLDALLINADLFFMQYLDYFSLTNLACINWLNIFPIIPEKSYNHSKEEIKQITFGSILGDGKLELPPRGLNARFGFTQSIIFEEYFLQLFSIFQPFCLSNFKIYSYVDKRTGKIYTSLSFRTRALPIFTEFYNMFYINKIKIVPSQREWFIITYTVSFSTLN